MISDLDAFIDQVAEIVLSEALSLPAIKEDHARADRADEVLNAMQAAVTTLRAIIDKSVSPNSSNRKRLHDELDEFIGNLGLHTAQNQRRIGPRPGRGNVSTGRVAAFNTLMARVVVELSISDRAAADYIAERAVRVWDRYSLTDDQFESLWRGDRGNNFVNRDWSESQRKENLRDRIRTNYAVFKSQPADELNT